MRGLAAWPGVTYSAVVAVMSRPHARALPASTDDLAQLEAGLLLYDAFYRWCRDAVDETHNWPSKTTGT